MWGRGVFQGVVILRLFPKGILQNQAGIWGRGNGEGERKSKYMRGKNCFYLDVTRIPS